MKLRPRLRTFASYSAGQPKVEWSAYVPAPCARYPSSLDEGRHL